MLEDGRPVGSSSAVPELRTCWLLRFIQEQACHEALSCNEASHYAIHRAWRNLGLVLHRRAPIGFCLSRIRPPCKEPAIRPAGVTLDESIHAAVRATCMA